MEEKVFVINFNTRTADFCGYDKLYKPLEEISAVTEDISSYDEFIGTAYIYILIFIEVMYYGLKLDHFLRNTNQY